MPDHDEIRLRHILEAALEAQSFLSGKSKDDFFSDRMISHAVIRSLEIAGEGERKIEN